MQTKSPAATTSRQLADKASMLAVDSAYAFTQYAEWNRALFVALEMFSKSDIYSHMTDSLVEIGNFISEEAISQAEGFGSTAEKIMDARKECEVPRE